MKWWVPTCAIALAAVLATGCGGSAFVCQSDDQCTGGSCEANGYCSFPDDACPSGRRYGGHAPDPIAGTCVDPSSTETSGSSMSSTSPSSTTLPSTGDTTTADPSTTTAEAEATTQSIDPETGSSTTNISSSTGASTGPGDVCPSYVDDFEDGVIGAEWFLTHPELTQETDGRLVILVDAPEGPFVYLWLEQVFDLSEGWCRAELADLPINNYVQQRLELRDAVTDDEAVSILVEGSSLIARHSFVGSEFENVANIPFDPELYRFVQIRTEGDLLHFETSSDGETFETFASIEPPFSFASVVPVIGGANWSAITEDTLVSLEEVQLCAAPAP